MTEVEVLDKFRGNAKELLEPRRCEGLISTTQRLESVDHVGDMVDLLKPA